MFFLCAAPALAVNGPGLLTQLDREDELEEQHNDPEQSPGLLDGILWMAAPKKRRTIEINRTRRRADSNVLQVKVHCESSHFTPKPNFIYIYFLLFTIRKTYI